MRIRDLIPKEIKRITINIILRNKYDVVFKSGASSDLQTYFEGKNLVNKKAGVYLSYVGYGTYISGSTSLSRVKIGKYCSVGQNVKNSFGIHPSKGFVSTHPAFYSTNKQAGFSFVGSQLFEEHKFIDEGGRYLVEIGNDVWIGNNVMLMDGVRIGDGAIVGTGAIITKDVAPYAIVGGVPAKVIRKRFSDVQIEFLLSFKWWDKDLSWIIKHKDMFNDIEKFYSFLK